MRRSKGRHKRQGRRTTFEDHGPKPDGPIPSLHDEWFLKKKKHIANSLHKGLPSQLRVLQVIQLPVVVYDKQ